MPLSLGTVRSFKQVPTDLRDWGKWLAEAFQAGLTGSLSTAQIEDLAVTTAKIAADAVTFAKMQNVATDTLLGRATAGTGDIETVTCTSAGRALIDDANAAAQRTTLGLGTSATVDTGTSGATVPLLNAANTHASAKCTLFAIGSATPSATQAANADTSGATLGDLETEVNQLKAVLRTFGLIAP